MSKGLFAGAVCGPGLRLSPVSGFLKGLGRRDDEIQSG